MLAQSMSHFLCQALEYAARQIEVPEKPTIDRSAAQTSANAFCVKKTKPPHGHLTTRRGKCYAIELGHSTEAVLDWKGMRRAVSMSVFTQGKAREDCRVTVVLNGSSLASAGLSRVPPYHHLTPVWSARC